MGLFDRNATMVLRPAKCELVTVNGKKVHVAARCKRCVSNGWDKPKKK